jgi:hypothetical protein
MTIEQIDNRIAKLEEERQQICVAFDELTNKFNASAGNYRNRYQQLVGAISELTELKSQLNGQTP